MTTTITPSPQVFDHVPLHKNRFAVWIGRILHPYWLCLVTLFVVLSDLPLGDAIRWSALVLVLVFVPATTATFIAHKRGHAIYHRETRRPLYIIGLICVLFCLTVLVALNAPRVLIAGLGAITMWVMLQALINAYVTKVSAHAAVSAGCITGLLLLGKLSNPVLLIGALLVIGLIVWARVITRHHTATQVAMGLLIGALPVLVVFPLVLS